MPKRKHMTRKDVPTNIHKKNNYIFVRYGFFKMLYLKEKARFWKLFPADFP